jgi:hypothetical protein
MNIKNDWPLYFAVILGAFIGNSLFYLFAKWVGL